MGEELQLKLLGNLEICRGERILSFGSSKARALLCYLAVTGRPHSRTALAGLLWGEMPEIDAGNNLRKALTHLRQMVGPHLSITRQTVAFNRDNSYWLDVEILENAVRSAPAEMDIDRLRQAVELYRGDFLEGFYVRQAPAFEEWVLAEQARLRELALGALDTLAGYYIRQGDAGRAPAINYTSRLLALEPWREESHRQIMLLLVLGGQRGAALAQYRTCRQVLAQEFGVEPGAETKALYERIRDGDLSLRTDLYRRLINIEGTVNLPQAVQSGFLQPTGVESGGALERHPIPIPSEPRLPLKPSSARGFPTSLWGRTTEMLVLRRVWRGAADGTGQVVLLEGEPGIGKTRLLEQLLVELTDQATILRAKCPELQDPLAYSLFMDPLRQAFAGELPRGLSDAWLADVARLLPELHDRYPNLSQPILLDPAAERRRVFDAVCAIFLTLAKQRPLVLFLDDLQWADLTSLELLSHFIDWIAEASVLILGAYRPHEVETKNALRKAQSAWQRARCLTRIVVEPLSQEAVGDLLKELTTWTGEDPSFGVLIYRETRGNPLFVVETVASLREEGRLPQSGEGWTREFWTEPLAIPRHVQMVIEARLNRLDEVTRQVLTEAAVMRGSFEADLLQVVSGHSKIETMESLERLLNSGLLVEYGRDELDFSHDKVREVAYGSLSQLRRRLLHRRVAETLEERYQGRLKIIAGRLAYHYERASLLEKTLEYHILAGQMAKEQFALETATSHYQKALAFLPVETCGASETSQVYQARRVELYGGLSRVLFWQGRLVEAAEASKGMLAAAQATGDLIAEVQAWAGLSRVQSNQGDYRAAVDSAGQAAKIARAAGVPARVELAGALYQQGWALYNLGEVQAALSLGEQVVAYSSELGPDARHELAYGLHLLGIVHQTLGHYEQANLHHEQSLALHRELGDRWGEVGLLINLGEVARVRGDYDAAIARYQEALTIAHEVGERGHEIVILSNLGGAKVGQGEYHAAEADLRQVIHKGGDASRRVLPETYCFLAEALLGLSRIDEALGAARQALALAQEREDRELIGLAYRALGMVAAQLSEPTAIAGRVIGQDHLLSDAAACFAQSLRMFEELGAEGERARTLRAWATYELERNDRAGGEAMWQQAREIFERLGMTLEVERMTGSA
jgi:DNA-binding SARP family transcriptional activator/tetratricopeptide (TPR) repeat protein